MTKAADLQSVPLQALDGTTTTLGAIAARPLVVVFVRHFGCLFCRERAAGLHEALPELGRQGASAVFVGPGSAAMAKDFARTHALGVPVLCDPERRLFAAAGMRRGLWTVLRLATLRSALRAFFAGHRQAKVQGDPMQQGGVLVLAADGKVVHAQRDCAAGDAIDWRAVQAAVLALS